VGILSALLLKKGNNTAKIETLFYLVGKGWHPWLGYFAPFGLWSGNL
jgi:hypothetical protein